MSSADRDARIAEIALRLRKIVARKVAKSRAQNYEATMVTVNIADLEAVIAELRAALSREEEAKKDAERLDWLGSRAFTAYRSRDGWDEHGRAVGDLSNHVTVVDEDQRKRSRYGCVQDSLRAAIDEAMGNVAPPPTPLESKFIGAARSVSLSENG